MQNVKKSLKKKIGMTALQITFAIVAGVVCWFAGVGYSSIPAACQVVGWIATKLWMVGVAITNRM